MIVNVPLILVSVLFFLALSSALYLVSWTLTSAILAIFQTRITPKNAKRILFAALIAPPILAAIPTVDGATFKHNHALMGSDHHNMLCEQMFVRMSQIATLHGSAVAGAVVNGLSWGVAAIGLFLTIRLVAATIGLERGLAPFLEPPSPKLASIIAEVSKQMPGLRKTPFFECAIPTRFSSVFGVVRIRCVLSKEFVEESTEDELLAVVAHEAAHLDAHDVQSSLVIAALNCLFFPLRPVRLLSRRWKTFAELACDDQAVGLTHNPIAMASAILRANGVSGPSKSGMSAATMSFSGEAACPSSVRVERLIEHTQNTLSELPKESRLQAAVAWAFTVILAGLGISVLMSAEAACYAHCSLETVARLLP